LCAFQSPDRPSDASDPPAADIVLTRFG